MITKDQNIKRIGISNNVLLLIIFVAIIGDYIVTYIGINILCVIEELNPLMKTLFNLPLHLGLLLRIVIALFPIVLLKLVENKCPPSLPYNNILKIALIIQIIPFSMHIIWIYRFLSVDFNIVF